MYRHHVDGWADTRSAQAVGTQATDSAPFRDPAGVPSRKSMIRASHAFDDLADSGPDGQRDVARRQARLTEDAPLSALRTIGCETLIPSAYL